jgi:uncharacterized RDD family membrane protein YckC
MDSQSQPEYTTPQIKYAGFWIRFAALLIDGMVLGVLNLFIFAIGFYNPHSTNLVGVLSIVVPWAYFIFMTNQYGGSLGKLAVGIIVLSVESTPLNIGQIIL